MNESVTDKGFFLGDDEVGPDYRTTLVMQYPGEKAQPPAMVTHAQSALRQSSAALPTTGGPARSNPILKQEKVVEAVKTARAPKETDFVGWHLIVYFLGHRALQATRRVNAARHEGLCLGGDAPGFSELGIIDGFYYSATDEAVLKLRRKQHWLQPFSFRLLPKEEDTVIVRAVSKT